MTVSRSGPRAADLLVSIAGGIVFALALGLGVLAYVDWFSVVAGPWSAARAAPAITIDTLLFSGFALHHSIFARTGARQWMAARVSPRLERTVYVWIASLLFILVCIAWQPVPGVAWAVSAPWGLALSAAQLGGVWLSLQGARQLDVWELAGIRQALGTSRPPPATPVGTGLYRLVRHPVYLGWVLMVWPAATMTGTRLTFAALSTGYLILAIPFEERSLRREFGAEYEAYTRRVRWRLLPYVY